MTYNVKDNLPWSSLDLDLPTELDRRGDLVKVSIQTEEETGPKDHTLPM